MFKMREVVIASAARLPVGKLGGALLHTEETDMAITVIKEAMRRQDLLIQIRHEFLP